MTPLIALIFAGCSPCGNGAMCGVDGGRYLAVEPADVGGPYPVLLYFHGYQNSPEGVQDKGTVVPWRDAGYLTVFPEGRGGSWSNVGSPHDDRDELAFTQAVLDDVAERFDVADRVVVTGHSHGSSMAWDVACYLPERVDALVGSSGSFWVPEPVSCEAPVPVRHTHGTSDRIMPLEGRPIGSSHQGSVFEGIDAWKATNGCEGVPRTEASGDVACEVWTCASGDVRLCLHDGGHGAPRGWAGRAIDWVETVVP
jgi:polyhydroxybutyrate depolymerase